MRIYIIEDDITVVRLLQQIIADLELGIVVGYSLEGQDGLQQIESLKPDICLVDFFIPGLNGLEIVKSSKQSNSNISFIMISQVSAKDIIGNAFESGIEYYITKPVNAKEVENVIKKVVEKIDLDKTLMQIKGLLHLEELSIGNENNYTKRIRRVMQRVGIIGKVGSEDIFNIVKYLMENNISMSHTTIKEICVSFGSNPKTIEQRVRRTAMTGLTNLAHLGIEDYMNEIFIEYVNSLYSFEQVRKEMDYIRDHDSVRGKVNIKKFLDGIAFLSSK